jgi:hypothetical protein
MHSGGREDSVPSITCKHVVPDRQGVLAGGGVVVVKKGFFIIHYCVNYAVVVRNAIDTCYGIIWDARTMQNG